eukprot:1145798-Pelagomonas_calceolata.AAC.5
MRPGHRQTPQGSVMTSKTAAVWHEGLGEEGHVDGAAQFLSCMCAHASRSQADTTGWDFRRVTGACPKCDPDRAWLFTIRSLGVSGLHSNKSQQQPLSVTFTSVVGDDVDMAVLDKKAAYSFAS